MKKIGKIMLLIGFFVIAISSVAFAQEDRKGCKDHPMFTRMGNFYLYNCDEKNYDEVDFRDERGKEIKVEGKVYEITYRIKEGFTPPSGLEVIRNYENAIKKIGGVKIFQKDKYYIWLKLDKAGKTFWVYVNSYVSTIGEGKMYMIRIIEQKAMEQQVIADAKSLMSDIQAKGSASVYGIYFDFDKADIKPESEP
ncbi:MAG: hypothetical protein ABIL70_09720, partial [candidate division WOR-3 bacterium]